MNPKDNRTVIQTTIYAASARLVLKSCYGVKGERINI
jgi:hypothetical protein